MARTEALNGRSDLRTHLATTRGGGSLLEVDAWIPSEISAISPLVERLMRLIEGSHCITGEDHAVQLALREALNNAVVHGNRLDAHKLVHVRCRCKVGRGISLIVADQGQGFDPRIVPDSMTVENLEADHGRGHSSHEVGDGRGLVRTGRHRGSYVQEASSQCKWRCAKRLAGFLGGVTDPISIFLVPRKTNPQEKPLDRSVSIRP